MKRYWFGVLVLLVFALFAPTRADANAQWVLGVKGGFNWATLRGSDVGSPDYRMSIVAGGYASVSFHKYFGVRLEGFFSPKGAEKTTQGLVSSSPGPSYLQTNGTLNLSYLEFPLLAVVQLPHGEKVRYMAFAGPYYAIKLGASFEASTGGTGVSTSVSDRVEGSDYGGVIGVGVEWDTENFRVVFDARYSYGFSSIDTGGFDVHNNVFALMLGFGIRMSE